MSLRLASTEKEQKWMERATKTTLQDWKDKIKKKIKDFICAALRLHFSCKNQLNNLTLTHPWVRRVRRAPDRACAARARGFMQKNWQLHISLKRLHQTT